MSWDSELCLKTKYLCDGLASGRRRWLKSFPETVVCIKAASISGENSSEMFLFYITSFTLDEYFFIWDVILASLTEFKKKRNLAISRCGTVNTFRAACTKESHTEPHRIERLLTTLFSHLLIPSPKLAVTPWAFILMPVRDQDVGEKRE